MGYRSRVIFGIKDSQVKELKQAIAEELQETVEYYAQKKNEFEAENPGVEHNWGRNLENAKKDQADPLKGYYMTLVKNVDGLSIFDADGLKWYGGYPIVEKVNELVEAAEDDGAFVVAIGEENEIHSDYGEWYEYVGIRVEVDIY